MIRNQRQNDQRGGGQHQRIVEFLLGQQRAREVMQPAARKQQHRQQHAQPRGECGNDHGEAAQQEREKKRNFSGEAGVLIVPPPVRNGREQCRAQRRGRKQHGAAQHLADSAQQRRDGEGADAGGATQGPLALAPLALDADQQPDAKRRGKIEPVGIHLCGLLPRLDVVVLHHLGPTFDLATEESGEFG